MKPKPNLADLHPGILAIAALIATAIAIGLLLLVSGLFRSDGFPMEQLVNAERACAHHIYVSEREVCMSQWLAASHASRIAKK